MTGTLQLDALPLAGSFRAAQAEDLPAARRAQATCSGRQVPSN
jgi:hypothetical protein